MIAQDDTNTDQPKSGQAGGGIPWRIRLRSELSCSYPMHCLEEAEREEAPFKRQIDIRQCLAPYRPIIITSFSIPRWLKFLKFFNNKTFYIRCILLAIALHVFYTDVTSYPPHNLWVYMFYLTHWGHVLNMFCLLCSWICSVVYNNHNDAIGNSSNLQAPRLAKLTWSLYSTAAPLSIAIALLYWTAIAPAGSPPDAINYVTGYVTIMEHGGVCLFVLLDGIIVGTVPVRAKQFVYLLFVCSAYLLWSIVNYIMHLGNGEWGPEYDDDALYPVLKWGTETRMVAAMISGFAIVVLCPLVYFMVWMLSLMSIEDINYDGDERPPEGCCGKCCGICCCCCCTACRKKQILWEGRQRRLLPANAVSASNSIGIGGYDNEHGTMYNEMPAGRLA